jgi:hypothetical protein
VEGLNEHRDARCLSAAPCVAPPAADPFGVKQFHVEEPDGDRSCFQ